MIKSFSGFRLSFFILLLLMFSFSFVLMGCGGDDPDEEEASQDQDNEEIVQEGEIKLYFMEDTGVEFVKSYETREIGTVTPREVMDLYLEGPQEENLIGITTEVELLNLEIEDGKAVVDLSSELLDISLGNEAETVFVDTIVYTLTEFEEIEEVQILVEGEKADSISGHVDITGSLTR